MSSRTTALLLLILTLVCLGVAPSPARATTGPIRVRIGIVADGIYRLTPADLAAVGVDATAVDPRTFALSSLGRPVAIRVVGEEDGRFDLGDAVEFFGERFRGDPMAEKYTDERVYWLGIGGIPGLRVAEVDATPIGHETPPADFAATVRGEENHYWYTYHTLTPATYDTWLWAELRPVGVGQAVTVTLPYTVPYPVAQGSFRLTVELSSRAAVNRRTTIAVGGVLVGDYTWSGKTTQVFTLSVPAGRFRHGRNDVLVGAFNLPPTPADWLYVNYWQLDYRRLFRAWEGRLDFRAERDGPREYLSDGWDVAARVAVWEITDPTRPRRLVGARPETGAVGQGLRFRGEGGIGARYWLQDERTFGRPATLRLRPPTDLRAPSRGYEVVIVTSFELAAAAQRLAAWHERQGRSALVVPFADAVDVFNDGITHPRAVPALLAWAQAYWPAPKPRYLVLFGDGHWNFKGYNPSLYPPQPQHIPPFLAWVDPWQGEVPADSRYADTDGDGLPDLAVGRRAVNTPDEAAAVVAKIEGYETDRRRQLWQRRVLFVADNDDEAGDFSVLSDAILTGHLPADLIPQRVYLGSTVADAAAARQAIAAALNEGVFMVQYAGHGAPNRWAHEQIWTTADVAGLSNHAPRLPLVLTFNCLDGYFAHPQPGLFALAEVMQRRAGGGAIAAISPSGLGFTPDQHRFRELLMDALFDSPGRTLGEALLAAQRAYYHEVGGPHYLIETMTLFGDPALRLPGPAETLYLPMLNR
ncbi:MAG: C25 family cysteine peptidase, partial [Anaerolineae bacterium]|nr:C25 family cysteine peptidase [Anaerolineae bacterium]